MPAPVRRFGMPDGEMRAGDVPDRAGLLSGTRTGLGGEAGGEPGAGFCKGRKGRSGRGAGSAQLSRFPAADSREEFSPPLCASSPPHAPPHS